MSSPNEREAAGAKAFPAYPEYKDSGVKWLGEVPAHWEVKPLKRAVFSVESGTSVNAADIPVSQNELGVLKTSCVYKGFFNWRENKTVNREDLERVSCPLRENTLIVSRMNTPDLVGSAGLVINAPAGIYLPDRLWQISLEKECNSKYYHFFTRTPTYRDQVKIACAGTSSSMQNLGQDEFGAIWHPSPSVEEQQAIATFLGHETARIDALIAEQQRLIALLKEKRQAVISHAVTKGLDPDAPMKDSGVEWLGDVPAHWEVRKASYIGRLFGSDNVPEDMVSDEGDVPYLKVGSLSTDSLEVASWDWYVDLAMSRPFRDCGHYVVFPKRGAAIFLNKVNVVSCPALIDPNLMGWEIEGRHSTWYFAYSLKLKKLDELADVSTVPQINNKHIGPERFPVPPIEEQNEIVSYLKKNLGDIDELVVTSEAGMKLLHERRSALISAAVTGKIDVRGWQPPAGSSASTESTQTEMV